MEKEKFAGTSPGAYLASKIVFLSVLVLIQSLWMFAFVQYCWPLRGDVVNHLIFLLLANAAMTMGIDGVFMEVHKDPDHAMSDGPNQVYLKDLEKILLILLKLLIIIKIWLFLKEKSII